MRSEKCKINRKETPSDLAASLSISTGITLLAHTHRDLSQLITISTATQMVDAWQNLQGKF